MAYAFKQEGSIARNVNRILAEEVKAALDALESPDQANGEAIHSIRKRIKKIRALFRLVRSELKEKDFQRENSHYRAIGHQLSGLRDATVMIKTLDKLREDQPDRIAPQVYATLHKALVSQQDQATREFFEEGSNIKRVIDALRQASRRVPGLSGKQNSFRLLDPNLKDIYRRARKALKVTVDEPTIDHFHELRKHVKNSWYHIRLLQPIWPGLFRAYEQEFGRLGELLGDDHDFGVLAQAIESDQLLLRNKQAKEAILQGLHEQRVQLQEQIYPLANRLLAEKAGSFVKRFRLYWKVWRAEADQKPVIPSQAT